MGLSLSQEKDEVNEKDESNGLENTPYWGWRAKVYKQRVRNKLMKTIKNEDLERFIKLVKTIWNENPHFYHSFLEHREESDFLPSDKILRTLALGYVYDISEYKKNINNGVECKWTKIPYLVTEEEWETGKVDRSGENEENDSDSENEEIANIFDRMDMKNTMRLVAYGAQDIYPTGNPKNSFFKLMYRR